MSSPDPLTRATPLTSEVTGVRQRQQCVRCTALLAAFLSHASIIEEITSSLDGPFETVALQPLLQLKGIVEYLDDFECPAVVEPSFNGTGITNLGVIPRCRILGLQAVNKEDLARWLQSAAYHVPEPVEFLGWNMREPEAKEYKVVLPSRMPCEEICDLKLDMAFADLGLIDFYRFHDAIYCG